MVARKRALSCGELRTPRMTRLGMTARLLGGVEIDDAREDDSDAKGFFIARGAERTNSGTRGVRGVGQPLSCSQQSSHTLPGTIGERGDS